MQRPAQLIRFGAVLGIVDHDKFAAGERQRIIQRLRFGAWREVRNDDDLDIPGRPQGTRCGNRLAVSGLEDELNVLEPAIGDHHLVRVHASAMRDRAGARQGGLIDEAAEEEVIL